jgi:glutathione-regulated potassium-efflux system ancillary protein KefG
VLEHGWAYGHGGQQLVGKITLNALTAGGPEGAYRPEGHNRFTIRQLLTPWEATANLCGMRFLAPFVVHGALRLAGNADVEGHVADYGRLLRALCEDRLDLDAAARAERLNADLDALVRPGPTLAARPTLGGI